MAKHKISKSEGHYLEGDVVQIDDRLEFIVTGNPEIDSQGGAFTWKTMTNRTNSWKLRDDVTAEDIIVVNTVAKTVSILAPYTFLSPGTKITSSANTLNATPVVIDAIDTLTDNSVHFIEVKTTCKSTTHTEYGMWYTVLSVTKIGGTPVIRVEDLISNHTSAGLSSVSVSYSVNAGNIDITVTGITATDIQWDSQYEIITKSTN